MNLTVISTIKLGREKIEGVHVHVCHGAHACMCAAHVTCGQCQCYVHVPAHENVLLLALGMQVDSTVPVEFGEKFCLENMFCFFLGKKHLKNFFVKIGAGSDVNLKMNLKQLKVVLVRGTGKNSQPTLELTTCRIIHQLLFLMNQATH